MKKNFNFDNPDSYQNQQFQINPERHLLMAILERAILDYVGNQKNEIAAAEEWLFGKDSKNNSVSFSFAWICEQLDLDIERVAKIILDMPKRGSRKMAPWYFPEYREAC